ncbi:glycosyltransferase family 2 protein [Tepidanaerobacter sp. EBM-38]|uniref:glycosyltransferase family 2 protein n=1 Tax=Tepidanaerobacter sp. EBM-38 TaxID=1918496 RepID=UPI000ABB362E|nr:glycosyltransferase family 2 protein [Tepidanaerobacter sp. EBM-38]
MKIAVVMPAYNEEKTIGNVLKPLSNHKLIDEIIVISDGSSDNTAKIAKSYKARVIELEKNQGKTNAVLIGVKNTDADIILMLDADLIGLNDEHITSLLQPIIDKKADMTIGIFKSGRGATDLAQKIAPFLSGQRAISRSVFCKLEKHNVKDYGIEMALTLMAEKEKIRVQRVYLPNLTHVMKEEKRGAFLGFISRIKMYVDIISSAIKFKFN